MYTPGATKSEAAALGLKLSTLEDTVDIWVDNFDAFLLFDAMSTQWRVGMSGATGLDYGVWRRTALDVGVKPTKELFGELRIMENEAITTMLETQND